MLKFKTILGLGISLTFSTCLIAQSLDFNRFQESNSKLNFDLNLNISSRLSPKPYDDYSLIVGPSFGYFFSWMHSTSLNKFVETYNSVNTGQLDQEMKPIGMMTGVKYGFTFSYENSRGLPLLFYFGQQRNQGSMEAVLSDGYSRKIDYMQKDLFDFVCYIPLNNYLFVGTKLAWTTQVIDAYRMYGEDRVYDMQSSISGIYRSSFGNLTAGLELKGNITIKNWIIISPGLGIQSTLGNGESSYFKKSLDQWSENDNPNTYYFPADYNGYVIANSNYTTLPPEALLKPKNRMVVASVSVLFNIGNFFN